MLKSKDGTEFPCICVTNRTLCRDDFLDRIRRIAARETVLTTADSAGTVVADAILLREKDLPEEEYFSLAENVMKICHDNSMPCILHSFYRVAKELGCRRIHLPLGILEDKLAKTAGNAGMESHFDVIGTSIHSVEQAEQAVMLGAHYMTAGHVFETDCKKGIPGRGLDFIREVTQAVKIPVYAIGGIDTSNAPDTVGAGAAGVCIMSGFMLEKTFHL